MTNHHTPGGKTTTRKRIGIMLRGISEKQGTGVYTRNLVRELLQLDTDNDYVLFHREAEQVGSFKGLAHVKEILVRAPGKAIWDQVMIPYHARREKLDLIFHPKFTVPFFTKRKTVMTIHGASWFVRPDLYGRGTIAYIRAFMPLYCRKADAILSNSELTTRDFVRILGVPQEKITTVHLGTDRVFHPIDDAAELDRVRRKYHLPDKFILTVSRFDPRKNFANIVETFRLLRRRLECKLVVTGLGFDESKLGEAAGEIRDDVTFAGWVEHDDLPALYNLARCLFFPSVYEEFGIPACEAMACGCPPIVANTGALPEVTGEAGIQVDPFSPQEMAAEVERLYTDDVLHAKLREKSLARAAHFTWQRCARETLTVLQDALKQPSST